MTQIRTLQEKLLKIFLHKKLHLHSCCSVRWMEVSVERRRGEIKKKKKKVTAVLGRAPYNKSKVIHWCVLDWKTGILTAAPGSPSSPENHFSMVPLQTCTRTNKRTQLFISHSPPWLLQQGRSLIQSTRAHTESWRSLVGRGPGSKILFHCSTDWNDHLSMANSKKERRK